MLDEIKSRYDKAMKSGAEAADEGDTSSAISSFGNAESYAIALFFASLDDDVEGLDSEEWGAKLDRAQNELKNIF